MQELRTTALSPPRDDSSPTRDEGAILLSVLREPRARPSFINRAALRLGLWLLLRGTRPAATASDYEKHSRLHAAELARQAREIRAIAQAPHIHTLTRNWP